MTRILILAIVCLVPSTALAERIEWRTHDGTEMSWEIEDEVFEAEFDRAVAWSWSMYGQPTAGYEARAFEIAMEQVRLFRLRAPLRRLSGNNRLRFIQETVSFGRTSSLYGTYTGLGVVRLPSLVLGTGYGDCDDKSLLVASILRVAGIDAGVWSMPRERHAGLAVTLQPSPFWGPILQHDDYGDWHFVEMTGQRWPIGALPHDRYTDGSLILPMER